MTLRQLGSPFITVGLYATSYILHDGSVGAEGLWIR